MDGIRRIVLRNRKHLKPVEYFKVRDPDIERRTIKEQVRNDRSLENENPDKGNKVVEEIDPTTPNDGAAGGGEGGGFGCGGGGGVGGERVFVFLRTLPPYLPISGNEGGE